MNLDQKAISKLVDEAGRILVVGPANPNLDTLSSTIAWVLFLAKMDKKVDVVLEGKYSVPKFLPNDVKIAKSLGNLSKFKIVLDLSQIGVKQLSYDIVDDKLEINIVPEDGNFSAKDLSSKRGDYKYDLIITLGATKLEALGDIYADNKHFFSETNILNIDLSVHNDNFGQLNVIEASASSIAEISYYIFDEHVDKDIATCLLTGIIIATSSFQSPQVTPELLELSSQLIIKGANRAEIIQGLYRTKNIATLKSWGKVLSRLVKEGQIIFSFLENNEADNDPYKFGEVVNDLILSTPQVKVVVIFYQLELNRTTAWVYTIKNIKASDLVTTYDPSGHKNLAVIEIDKNIEESSEEIVAAIAKRLAVIND